MFTKLEQLIAKLNNSTSTLAKIEVLKTYKSDEDVKKTLLYTYNKMWNYGVTSKNLKKKANLSNGEFYSNLFDMLDDLRTRKITGHLALGTVNKFIMNNPGSSGIVHDILDHNLKIRVDEKIVNRVWPDLIPTFKVALANSFTDFSDEVDFENENWYSATKLDGARCLTIIDENGNVTFFSRQGKEFETLNNLTEIVKSLNLHSIVLDGEICIFDPKTGIEDFQMIMSEIRRKNHTIKNPKYLVFDIIKLEDFLKGKSNVKFEERIQQLKLVLRNYKSGNTANIEIVEQVKVNNSEHYQQLFATALDNKREGLILRKGSSIYEGKRSKNMLKCKEFHDAEYKVVGIVNGPIRYVVNNKEVTEDMVSKIIILHKGSEVGVGSGFSIQERKDFYKNPEEIVGKIITVAYFNESCDKSGKPSLRFPTVKCIHGNKRET